MFKKNILVIHYTNFETGLNIMIRENNSKFLSG